MAEVSGKQVLPSLSCLPDRLNPNLSATDSWQESMRALALVTNDREQVRNDFRIGR
jgi:hypothetical protein